MSVLDRAKLALTDYLDVQVFQDVSEEIRVLCNHILAGFDNPDGVQAIILYGSGLWQGADSQTIWDLYVLTDDYQCSTRNIFLRLAGSALPPNVYYTDAPMACKYAVMRMDQFRRGAYGRTVTPQIWARFSQPCRVVYVRDNIVRADVLDVLAQCVLTFHRFAVSPEDVLKPARSVWVDGLRLTYGQELRSEDGGRAMKIYSAAPDDFDSRTRLVLDVLSGEDGWKQRFLAPRWMIKSIYFVQLFKAIFTFQGAVDYALHKIEKHSGVHVQANDFQRNYPIIGVWPLLWQVYRKGGFR